jgi:hypothetical protein
MCKQYNRLGMFQDIDKFNNLRVFILLITNGGVLHKGSMMDENA